MAFENSLSAKRADALRQHFDSAGAMYVFVLLFMDGRTRCDVLSIKDEYFKDKNKAAAWRDSIQHEISTTHSPQNEKDQALGELNHLYRLMTNAANSN